MSKPIILANESLVLNGDFSNSFTSWKKGQTSPLYLGIECDTYNGVPISMLRAGNGSSVSQLLEVPRAPAPESRYHLTFLYELRHALPDRSGKLIVSVDGDPDRYQEFVLKSEPRDLEKDKERLANNQPLVFTPVECRAFLDLEFSAQETLKVEVISPANEPTDVTSAVYVTNIDLQLQLAPAVMQKLMLDDQAVPAAGTLYCCLGATSSLSPHELRFVLEPGNAWEGTEAALISEDNPLEAVVATPVWGENQAVDLPWLLDCPFIGDEAPYRFSMQLVNRYSAVPYPVQVSLGHHRVAFGEVLQAAYYPVLEYQQTVRLGVQVVSYYTNQPLKGLTVNWTITNGKVSAATVTDEQGWAYFDFQPEEAGDFKVSASVESRYCEAGVETLEEPLEVKVLATDPFNDLMVVDGVLEAHWAEKTGYPNRGSTYPVTLKILADSPLLGTELALHWSGDPHGQLGVVVSPALEHAVLADSVSLTWNLTSEDRLDGQFQLELVCSKLLLPSAKKTMLLARNLVTIGEVREANKCPVVDEQESVLLRIQVLHSIASGNGEPVVNALVEWTAESPIASVTSGAGGWASVLYTPQTAGDKVVTASIKAHVDAVAVEHRFTVNAIATSPWKDQVKIYLDNVEVERNTLGVLCRRGETHTLKVVPVTGSAWIDQNISLHWRGEDPKIGLTPSDLGVDRPLAETGVEWTFVSEVADSISSLFDLELRLGSQSVRELSGRLMAADLGEEMSLRLDQIAAELDDKTLYPCLGALHRFSVVPNALSPLVGLDLSLTWSGTSAEDLGATVQPALDTAQPINDGGTSWTLDFSASQTSGEFSLTLALLKLGFSAIAKPMTLAHNKVRIETWHEAAVDPVVGQDSAWLWVQVFSRFTNRAVDQVPVTWTADESSVVLTDAEGWAGYGVAPAIAGSHTVKASISSSYDGYEEQRSMQVTALESDPWAGLSVSFDGEPSRTWGEKTYFPRRKGTHLVEVTAQNSPLIGRQLTLGMTGTGPAALGIQFLPAALGVASEFVGLKQYFFNVGDLRDGSFALHLASERLASLSPANAMSLGEGSQVMSISFANSVKRTLLWGEEVVEQVTVISTISGKPMGGETVTWTSPELGVVTSVTDFYGVAKVRFVPKVPGEARLTATVGDGESVALSYLMNEPRRIDALTSPKQEGKELELVEANITVLSALSGEPLADVEVTWTYLDREIPATRTNAQGVAQAQFKLGNARQALLEATVTGGLAGWEVKHLEFRVIWTSSITQSTPTPTPTPTNTSLSHTWNQNFRPSINGERVRWGEFELNLTDGQDLQFELEYEFSPLIGDPEGFLALAYVQGAEGQGLVFDPPLGHYCEMLEGTTCLSWTIKTDKAASGLFGLEFRFPAGSTLPRSPAVPGDLVILEQDLEVKLDSLPSVKLTDTLYPCLGATHTLLIKPRRLSSVVGAKIQLEWSGSSAATVGVTIEPPLAEIREMTLAGLTWTLTGSREQNTPQSDSILKLITPEADFGSQPSVHMRYGHNLVTAKRGPPELVGVYLSDVIKLTSVHMGMDGWDVKCRYVHNEGELVMFAIGGIAKHRQLPGGRFIVLNLYNGTYV